MTLTMKEKDHWKERIEQKIERRINHIVEATDRGYLDEVKKKSRERAIKKLGLTEIRKQQADIDSKIDELNRELDRLNRTSIATVTSLADEEIAKMHSWEIQSAISSAIQTAQTSEERIVMEGDELGRAVLKLRDEQEELLDTVWLATSTKEIRDLWQSVAELLDETPATLQVAAMKSVAVGPDSTE